MESKVNLKTLILRTLIYADVFNYPMRQEEIIGWLITERRQKFPKDTVQAYLQKLNGVVWRNNDFFFLKKRGNLVRLRRNRRVQSLPKLQKAEKIARLLGIIPTIRLIGISGSLSMDNAKKEDDIDFLIITKAGTLWLTRLLAIILLEIFDVRRRPGDIRVEDKICLNMFMDEGHLKIPKPFQNLYTAHEVCQLKVIFERDYMYKKFLNENTWVKNYLPNAIRVDSKRLQYKDTKIKRASNILISQFLSIFERVAKLIQLFYMRLHGRREDFTNGTLCFYPKNYHRQILRTYGERIKQYGLSV